VNQYSAGNGCYIFILHGLLTFLYLCNIFIFFPHPSMNKVNTVAYLSFRCHYFEHEAESCVSVYKRRATDKTYTRNLPQIFFYRTFTLYDNNRSSRCRPFRMVTSSAAIATDQARRESGSTCCSSVHIAVSIRFLLAFRGGCWVFQFVL